MEFHGTKFYFIWRHQSSMEFHGIFHGNPQNTCVIWNGDLLIPWNPMELDEFLFGDSKVPWNSMELSDMAPSKFNGMPWNWVILLFGNSRVPWNSMESPMEVQGITWYWLKWQSQSSMKFYGTKLYFIWRHQSSIEFHGILHGIPRNTCVIWNGALLIP